MKNNPFLEKIITEETENLLTEGKYNFSSQLDEIKEVFQELAVISRELNVAINKSNTKEGSKVPLSKLELFFSEQAGGKEGGGGMFAKIQQALSRLGLTDRMEIKG